MAHYYTTRYNPYLWPPSGEESPPGVEWSESELKERGGACCELWGVHRAASEPWHDRWEYRTVYWTLCPAHGEIAVVVLSRLDWISPNEYLLMQERA